MKTKFTLLIVAGLVFAASTQAQDRGYDNDHRGGYKNDFRQERHEDFNYKTEMYNLQQRLAHEMDELDWAKECRDWHKVKAEKREIAEIRDEVRQKHFDNDDYHYKDHDYNSRF